MLPVIALRCAENRIRSVSNPTTAMIAPTTSSLRSGVRLAHHDTEAGCGGASRAVFPLAVCGLRAALSLLCNELGVLPLGFPPDLDGEEGVLRGMSVKSIAQMVCFSFMILPMNQAVS